MERKDIFFEIADLFNSLGREWINEIELDYRLREFLDDMEADYKLNSCDVENILDSTRALIKHIQI